MTSTSSENGSSGTQLHAGSRAAAPGAFAMDAGEHERLVTAAKMGDLKRVVSVAERFSMQDQGTLDRDSGNGLCERLLQHKLMKPVELGLLVSDGIAAADLAVETLRLFNTYPYLLRLFPLPIDRERAAAALGQLDLPQPLAVKLGAAGEQRPRLFDHLLVVTLICHYLARHLNLTARENSDLLMAALLHDIGELHTDPAMLEADRRLGRSEMRYIYAHPITGYLIAKKVAAAYPEVATAVLQHHERLDGSGYPYGLRGDAASRLARIVGVADVCAAILARCSNINRLTTLMRLNRKKFDRDLIALLQQVFGVGEDEDTAADTTLLPQIRALAKLLKHWDGIAAALNGTKAGPPPAVQFLFERMADLHAILLQFGFHPERLQTLRTAIAEDGKTAAESAAALNEVRWQLTDLEREIMRRAEVVKKALPSDKFMHVEDWLADLQHYREETAAPA